MTTVEAAERALAAPRRWRGGEKIADRTIAVLIFLSGFVIVEPAPYDVAMVLVVIIGSFFGLSFNRYTLPMTLLLIAYVAGGFLGFTQIDDFAGPLLYMMTTAFLAVSAMFYASVIVANPVHRLALIRNAYIFSALIVATIGILAYFGLFPDADYFKLYDRAKGTFQDPNVFAPFLALPAAFLARDVLTRRLRESAWEIAGLLLILFAIFLSFSRAAWGMTIFSLLVVAYLAFATAPRQLARFRLVAYLTAGGVAVTLMIAAAISLPSVHNLFEERAQVVQSYDDSATGRFERQKAGFFLIQEKPFGIGPFEFAKRFTEDEHNMWLKGFTVYGWLGGFAYIALVAWTLAAAAPLLFKPRPWQAMVQCTYAVYLGHIMIHNVIDNDHWRHLFLMYGILWGAIAAEKMQKHGWRIADAAVAPAAT